MWSDSYPDIKFFLKNNLSFFKENGSEYIIHCPYCGDEFRKNAHHHGHLYISSKHPVFHCFRCEMSGALYILSTMHHKSKTFPSGRGYKVYCR